MTKANILLCSDVAHPFNHVSLALFIFSTRDFTLSVTRVIHEFMASIQTQTHGLDFADQMCCYNYSWGIYIYCGRTTHTLFGSSRHVCYNETLNIWDKQYETFLLTEWHIIYNYLIVSIFGKCYPFQNAILLQVNVSRTDQSLLTHNPVTPFPFESWWLGQIR